MDWTRHLINLRRTIHWSEMTVHGDDLSYSTFKDFHHCPLTFRVTFIGVAKGGGRPIGARFPTSVVNKKVCSKRCTRCVNFGGRVGFLMPKMRL